MNTSVVIATYNGEKYIREQIFSILHQSVNIDQIVIVDDASTDGTISIMEELLDHEGESNYTIIKNKQNLGVAKTFEIGIHHTKGDLVFLSDQDDVWLREKVEIVVNYAKNNQNMQLFYTDGFIVKSDLSPVSTLKERYFKKYIKRSSARISYSLNLGNFVPGCSMAIK
jgi:glycosyltransferase involved in cell wall biosynthesis